MVSAPTYTAMLQCVSRDPLLNSTQRSVLLNVLGHVGTDGYAVRQDVIANEVGLARRTVKRAIAWLVEHEYLCRERRSSKAGRLADKLTPGPASKVPQQGATPQQNPLSQQGAKSSKVPLVSPLEEERSITLTCSPTQSGSDKFSQAKPTLRDLSETTSGESPPSVPESVGSPHLTPGSNHAMTAFDRVTQDLTNIRRNGKSLLASCPVASHGRGNGDRNPSLSVTEKDGQVLIHCQTGCHIQDVMVALGLDWDDLWDEPLTKDTKVAEWVYLKRDGSPYMVAERWNQANGRKRFVQRIPGEKAGLPANFQPCLYQLPKVLAAAAAHEPIWFVEGEKCVAAAEFLGVTATCGPGGVNNWRDYYADLLNGASVVNVVADNDTPGRAFAGMVTAMLKSRGIPVKTWAVAVSDDKADLYDHVLAGKTLADLVPLRVNQAKPDGTSLATLRTTDFPPVTWVVPGLLPTGLAMLAASPKVGKSLLALDLSLGVGSGMDCLGEVATNGGSVLYLSLDNDTLDRLKRRSDQMIRNGRGTWGGQIEFHTEWPTGPQAIQACIEWCENERDDNHLPRLIVADTLAMIEPNYEGGPRATSGGYAQAVHALAPWARMAAEQNIALLTVHHDRKPSQGDTKDNPWDRILGSRGLQASVHTMLYLDVSRGGNEPGMLRVLGRDVGMENLEATRDGVMWQVERPISQTRSAKDRARQVWGRDDL